MGGWEFEGFAHSAGGGWCLRCLNGFGAALGLGRGVFVDFDLSVLPDVSGS